MNIFQETWDEYLKVINHPHEDNRKRHNVECRAAFTNASTHFFHNDDIAALWKKDRTTVYHYISSHETYYRYSKDYREWFNAATDVVSRKVEDVDLNYLNEQAKNKLGAHEQIDSIRGTIKVLQNVLSKIQNSVRRGKSPKPLPNGGEGGVPNDEGHLGDRLIHRLLRDEQLQVSDESRQEAGAVDREGYAESTVVRGAGKGVEE